MVDELRRRPRVVAIALLLVTATVWGSTFVVVKTAVGQAPVMDFLAWRFVLGGALLAVLRPRALVRLGWRGAGQGAVLGLVLAAGYILQTYGLRYTPAAVSGFLTGLQVVFTPVVAWLLLRHRPGARTWTAALVALSGLAVLSLRAVSLGTGEVLTVASAAMFALQLVALGEWASVEDAYGLATVQLLTVGAVSLVGAAPGGLTLPSTPSLWGAVALTALGATAFAFVVQSWAQSHVSATTAAVVYTTEPLFAALFAWIAGERLGWGVLVGGALVVGAMVVLGVGSAGTMAAPDPYPGMRGDELGPRRAVRRPGGPARTSELGERRRGVRPDSAGERAVPGDDAPSDERVAGRGGVDAAGPAEPRQGAGAGHGHGNRAVWSEGRTLAERRVPTSSPGHVQEAPP